MASSAPAEAEAEAAPDVCIQRVIAASTIENEAITLDRAGDAKGAISKYEECEKELAAAIAVAATAHAGDKPALEQHRREVLERAAYLKANASSGESNVPLLPVEDHIKAVQLGMQAASSASSAVSSAGGVKTMAACAALGAGAGVLVLGSTVGVTLALVGGGASAAYVATRSDKAGDAARSVGNVAVQGVDRAQKINEEHKITEKIADAGGKAVAATKSIDQKFKISDKVKVGVGAVVSKTKEMEDKHKVTDKVASGVGFGLGKLSSALDGVKKRTSTSESAGNPYPGGGTTGAASSGPYPGGGGAAASGS